MKKNVHFIILVCLFQVAFSYYSVAQNCSINAGVNKSICLGNPINLDGNISTPYNASTIIWTLVTQPAGAATAIANPKSLFTNAGTPTVTGDYTFRISAVCGDGVAIQDDITITVNPVPATATQSGPFTFSCAAVMPVTLTGNTPAAGETVKWETIGGYFGSFSSSTTATTTFTPQFPLDECSNTLYIINIKYTITNASGCATSVTNTYSFDRNYPLSAIADPTPACGTSTFLKGSCPGKGPALWSTVSTPAGAPAPVFANASSRNTNVSGLVAGTYIFRYTVSAPSCNAGTVDVTVVMTGGSGISKANAGADQYFCTVPNTISLNGNRPAVGETVSWTKLSGGSVSFGSSTSANTTVSGLTDAGMPYQFLYTIYNASGCSSTDTVAVYTYPKLTLTNTGLSTCAATGSSGGTSGNVTLGSYGYKQMDTVSTSITYLSGPYSNVASGWTIENGASNFNVPRSVNLGQTVTVILAGTTGSTPLYVPGLTNPEFGLYSIENYFNLSAVGTYKFHVSYTTKCGTYETDVTATRGYKPDNGVNAGTDVYLTCNATTATLAGSISPVASGDNLSMWKTVQMPAGAIDPINASNQNLRNPPLTGLLDGTYIFRYSNNPGPNCNLVTDDIKVVVSSTPPSAANAGADQTLCAGIITLNGSAVPVNALAQWTVVAPVGAAVTFSDATIANPMVAGLLPGTAYTFRYTLANGCGSQSDDVVITTGASSTPDKPVISVVGRAACTSTDITTFPTTQTMDLNHTLLTGTQTGVWSVLVNPASALTAGPTTTFISSTSDKVSIILSGEASVSYVYSVSDASCSLQTVSDTVTILYKTATNTINAGPDQQLCSITSFPATVTLTGTSTTLNTQWSLVYSSNGQPATITTPGTNSTTVSLPASGTYRFQYTYIGTNPACAQLTDYMEVNVSSAAAIAIAGPDISFCNASGSTTLAATALPATDKGQWQIVKVLYGTPPIINNINAANSPINFSQPGSVILKWNSFGSNPVCGASSSDQVTVTYIAPARAGSDQSLCAVTSAILNAQDPSPATGVWTKVSGPAATIADAGSNQTVVSGLTAGTYTFRWTVTAPPGATACVPSDDVMITVTNSAVVANAGIDLVSCSGGSNTIKLNAVPALSGTTGTWAIQSYPAGATAGTFTNLHDPATRYNGVTVAGTYIFSWTVTDGICSSTDFVTITATNSTVCVLPIQLISFDAAAAANGVELRWVVAEELNVKNYEILFSSDGIHFTPAGSVPAVNAHTYSFLHTTPVFGNNFYRLRINDQNGNSNYSNIVAVLFGTGSISVYPNPVQDQFNITFSKGWLNKTVDLQLYNEAGQLVWWKQIQRTASSEKVIPGRLPNGVYTLKLVQTDLTTEIRKLWILR